MCKRIYDVWVGLNGYDTYALVQAESQQQAIDKLAATIIKYDGQATPVSRMSREHRELYERDLSALKRARKDVLIYGEGT